MSSGDREWPGSDDFYAPHLRRFHSMVLCDHANETPRGGVCHCPLDCGCREHMCRAFLSPRTSEELEAEAARIRAVHTARRETFDAMRLGHWHAVNENLVHVQRAFDRAIADAPVRGHGAARQREELRRELRGHHHEVREIAESLFDTVCTGALSRDEASNVFHRRLAAASDPQSGRGRYRDDPPRERLYRPPPPPAAREDPAVTPAPHRLRRTLESFGLPKRELLPIDDERPRTIRLRE